MRSWHVTFLEINVGCHVGNQRQQFHWEWGAGEVSWFTTHPKRGYDPQIVWLPCKVVSTTVCHSPVKTSSPLKCLYTRCWQVKWVVVAAPCQVCCDNWDIWVRFKLLAEDSSFPRMNDFSFFFYSHNASRQKAYYVQKHLGYNWQLFVSREYAEEEQWHCEKDENGRKSIAIMHVFVCLLIHVCVEKEKKWEYISQKRAERVKVCLMQSCSKHIYFSPAAIQIIYLYELNWLFV